jgi:hypothetical protein
VRAALATALKTWTTAFALPVRIGGVVAVQVETPHHQGLTTIVLRDTIIPHVKRFPLLGVAKNVRGLKRIVLWMEAIVDLILT